MEELLRASQSFEGAQGGTPEGQAPHSQAYYPTYLRHRRLIPDPSDLTKNIWERCQGWDEGHEVDSRVHHYHREVGFQREQEDQDMIDRNPTTAAAFQRRRQDPKKRKAHSSTVTSWSMFERWVLSEMPHEPYAAFLDKCDKRLQGIRFIGPPVALVVTYMDELRSRPLKGGSIKAYTTAISSTCVEHGAATPCRHADVKDQLKAWIDEDGSESARAFDMESDMKLMWGVVFSVRGWSDENALQYWAMFLVAISIFARASEMTVTSMSKA